jgi:YidC/Oxa1 family membrane protein insertase
MKFDKETIIAITLCVLALVLTPAIINKFFPARELPAEPPLAAAATNAPTVEATAVSGTASNVPAAGITATPAQPVVPVERSPEETVTLRNDLIAVEFTSWGGGIKSVELLKHPNNGSGNIVLNGPDVTPSLSVNNIPGAGAEAAYRLSADSGSRTVTMTATTAQGLTVVKKVSLGEDYQLSVDMTVSGTPPPEDIAVVVGTATPSNAKELPDYLGSAWLANGKLQVRHFKHADKQKPEEFPESVTWAAVKSQFFAMVLTPATNTSVKAVAYHAVDLPRTAEWTQKKSPRGLTAIAQLKGASGPEGSARTYQFTCYTGPKEYGRLQRLGREQELVMDFGFWGAISVILLKSMNFLHGLIPNYGIAIIIITFIIKILFWPIQAKSIRSMKEMQKFQPLMAKLREKYKDDPQKMNVEMMKLYKEHKINPFAGCLPMVVQIPVFFALFAMLRTAIELRGAHFLWIKDLSQPDTIAHLAGFGLNPLPLVMGATMIWQMKLTPSGGDPKQQQMMMIMPVVFLFICYNMSSGLVLYWTVQQVLSIAQQWWSMRQSNDKSVAGSQPAKAKA